MEVTVDTSVLVAVIVGEPERNRLIQLSAGKVLIGPRSIPWEIGNAFSSMLKQRRLAVEEAKRGIDFFNTMAIRYVDIDLKSAISLAERLDIYAYDAYILDCAIRYATSLLTLDRHIKGGAQKLGLKILEI